MAVSCHLVMLVASRHLAMLDVAQITTNMANADQHCHLAMLDAAQITTNTTKWEVCSRIPETE